MPMRLKLKLFQAVSVFCFSFISDFATGLRKGMFTEPTIH